MNVMKMDRFQIRIVIATYLLTLRIVDLRRQKSGRSVGSSFQHLAIILFKSSNV